MTAANPDAIVREFHDKAAPRDLGDPATDPPGTVRVRVDHDDRSTRLFGRDATRAIRTTSPAEPWVVFAGPRGVGGWVGHDEVRSWPTVPGPFVVAPWTLGTAPPPPMQPAQQRGDLDVQAFRG